jgi:5-methyltetrahydropteroyltriglutamate--homocysteine methyltransferase
MHSLDRFLTTHTGSLPRPDDLIEIVIATQRGDDVDPAVLEERITSAVLESTCRQVEAGVDIVNDGEMSKPSYATYIKDRLSGFGGESHPRT